MTFVLGMVFFNFVTNGMLHIRLGEKQGWGGRGGVPGKKFEARPKSIVVGVAIGYFITVSLIVVLLPHVYMHRSIIKRLKNIKNVKGCREGMPKSM